MHMLCLSQPPKPSVAFEFITAFVNVDLRFGIKVGTHHLSYKVDINVIKRDATLFLILVSKQTHM